VTNALSPSEAPAGATACLQNAPVERFERRAGPAQPEQSIWQSRQTLTIAITDQTKRPGAIRAFCMRSCCISTTARGSQKY